MSARPSTPPPAAWFAEPDPNEPHDITIRSDGRFTGHVLPGTTKRLWGDRSINYDLYHRRSVALADAGTLRAGAVLLDTAPVNPFLTAEEAMAQFDASGVVLAEVRATESEHGIWLCGATAPDVDEELVTTVNQRGLAGCWWRVDGEMALISIFVTPAVEPLGFTLLSNRCAVSTGLAPLSP